MLHLHKRGQLTHLYSNFAAHISPTEVLLIFVYGSASRSSFKPKTFKRLLPDVPGMLLSPLN